MAAAHLFRRTGEETSHLHRPDPPFVKNYHSLTNLESLRIPPQWVKRYGRDLPPYCTLEMPHGGKYSVRLLIVENGCYFRAGWSAFADINRFKNGDVLIFTHVGGGVFQVIRTDSMTCCPPLHDYDGSLWPIPERDVVHDLDTSDDYDSSEAESEAVTDDDDNEWPTESGPNEHPSFTVVFDETTITRTLEIPIGFWKQFLPQSAVTDEAYFTVGEGTWEMRLAKRNGKIRVKRGWYHFKQVNKLAKGMTCSFYLVNTEEVHFYVIIHP